MRLRYAVTGVPAAAGGLAAAEFAAALTRPESSPLIAIGSSVIDATPTPVKEFAVSTFGTADKPLLLGGIVAGVIATAALIGLIARRHRAIAITAMAGFGLIGAFAALTRPTAQTLDVLPAVFAGLTAASLLAFLTRPSFTPDVTLSATANPSRPATASPNRASVVSADRPAGAVPVGGSGVLPGNETAGVRAGAGIGPADAMAAAEGLGRRSAAKAGSGAATEAAAWKAGSGGGVARAAGDGAQGNDGAVRRRELLIVAAGVVATAGFARMTGVWKGRTRTSTVVLPAAADPAGARITSPGFYTANKDFYRVDTALTVPRVSVDGWQLRITGMVERPVTLTFEDLIRLPLTERDITLNCVSNEVGGPYIGTARWIGVPLAPLLRRAGIRSGADQVVARSTEGMTIGTPVETVLDGRDAMIAIGMNGEALPAIHGFPARMLTPGLYGYAGACKWVTELELSTFDSFDAYWVKRGWAARAPVKTASRIDRPAPFARLQPGDVTVAGVAWAQHRGIAKVEVQIDDGPWALAELLPVPSTDTWVQWRYSWTASTGGHSLRVRAEDGLGVLQTPDRATPFPDGATGWHTIAVTVG